MSTMDRFARMNPRHALLGGALAVLLIGVVGTSPLAAQNAPRHNSHTERAEQRLALARAQDGENATRSYFEALQSALQGIEADENNANGWYIAGQVYRSLDDFVAADSMFDRALELFPGFAADIEVEREIGWAEEYNRGAEAYNAGDLETAAQHFENAGIIFDKYPDHLMILGYLYVEFDRAEEAANTYLKAAEIFERGMPESLAEEPDMQARWLDDRATAFLEAGRILEYLDRPEESAAVYRRLLAIDGDNLDAQVRLATALSDLGQAEEAAQILETIGSQATLDEEQQFNLGIGFYQAQRFDLAAEAFGKAFETNPESRDAGYNLAQALFMQAQSLSQALAGAPAEEAESRTAELVATYEALLDATLRTRELDPFNRDMLFLLTSAYQGLAQNTSDTALAAEYTDALVSVIETHDSMPFEVSGVSLSAVGGGGLVLRGRLENLTMEPGTEARLRFTLVGQGGGEVASSIATVAAAGQGEVVEFSTDLNPSDEVFGWRYERVD